MSKEAFDKFINPKISGAKKKEAVRQEKRKTKAEARSKADERRKENEAKYGWVTKENKEKQTRDERQDARFKEQDSGYKKQESRIKIKDTRTKGQEPGFKGAAGKVKKASERSTVHKDAKEASTSRYVKHERSETETGTKGRGKGNQSPAATATDELMPLNKFVAHAGICARREAANLVKEGHIKVNGDIVYEPGYKVSAKDKVEVKGKPVFLQKNLVYILLNKPKDYITTAKDPEGRKTVFDLVANATKERIYPVGRLDRNTTGVLLMTNDGELAQKLTHPSFEVRKIYEVRLDKPLIKKDAEAILNGVTLEDGFIKADAVGYADTKDKSIIGIEIHSGRNRIVRRLFEFLGYDVKNLDRVMFANLTKKNVDRSKWRMLTDKEVRLLKYMNKSFVRSKKSE